MFRLAVTRWRLQQSNGQTWEIYNQNNDINVLLCSLPQKHFYKTSFLRQAIVDFPGLPMLLLQVPPSDSKTKYQTSNHLLLSSVLPLTRRDETYWQREEGLGRMIPARQDFSRCSSLDFKVEWAFFSPEKRSLDWQQSQSWYTPLVEVNQAIKACVSLDNHSVPLSRIPQKKPRNGHHWHPKSLELQAKHPRIQNQNNNINVLLCSLPQKHFYKTSFLSKQL